MRISPFTTCPLTHRSQKLHTVPKCLFPYQSTTYEDLPRGKADRLDVQMGASDTTCEILQSVVRGAAFALHAKQSSTGSPQFATIHNNDGFENRGPKISRNNNTNFKNCGTINNACEVKKQHSQKRATSIYHLSPSEIRLIKLLKQVPPCLVEVQ